jgi:integrase
MEVEELNTVHMQKQDIKVAGHLAEMRGIYQMALSWRLPDGTRARKSFTTHLPAKGNKKRAESMLQGKCAEMEGLLNAQQNGRDDGTGDILFADFVKRWLESRRSEIKKTTVLTYSHLIKHIIDPYFRPKGISLKGLTAEDIRAYYAYRLLRVKAATVSKEHVIINCTLNYAVQEEMVPYSIMNRVQRPKSEPYFGKFLKQSEAVALFNAVKGDWLEIGVLMGAFYGLRRGEVIGLKWSAIDFNENTISIKHTVTRALDENGKRVLIADDTTKTKSSFRTLPLVPKIRARLLEMKAEQEQRRRHLGRAYNKADVEYVYVSPLGKRISPEYLTKQFPAFLERNGFNKMRFHDLRHSCASLLLSCGVPLKLIQEWLGHSNFATTANTYTHLEYSAKVKAAEAMCWIDQTSL